MGDYHPTGDVLVYLSIRGKILGHPYFSRRKGDKLVFNPTFLTDEQAYTLDKITVIPLFFILSLENICKYLFDVKIA